MTYIVTNVMNNEPIIIELQDKTRCIQRITKLYNKLLGSNRIFEQDQAGINISDIYTDKKNITKILIRELLNGSYQPMQYDERKVYINSKMRLIANYSFIDRLLLGILYDLFRERTLHLISPSVYSYISGRSAKQAIQSFCSYLKQIQAPNKQINLYVLRADITNYGGSIPADTHAIFWNYFYDILEEIKDLEQRHCLRIVIEEALRPILHTEDNLPYQKIVGIPVGSPLATLIYNLYLSELDEALSDIPYGFYARYSDDFIYANTDINQFKEGERRITAILEKLRLRCNPSKNQRFYLTHAGKPSIDSEHFIGSNRIELCGLIIFSDGTKTLKRSVIQKMLERIKHRLINATPMLSPLNLEQKGQALCQIANNLLNENNSFKDPAIQRIFKEVTNRGCLKQIDYAIALIIVELLTGIKGARAFRKIPYATLRNEWHLTSLCREKNYWDQHKFSFRKNGVFTYDKDERFI